MFLDDLKEIIAQELKLTKADFSYPPNSDLGDISLACFELAKNYGQNPAELAKSYEIELVARNNLKKYFKDIKAYGPYLNFFVSPLFLAEQVCSSVKRDKEKYGNNNSGKHKKVMLEYSNGNTHKEYHVGHLRNISYGDAIYKLLLANGYEAIPVSYINDFGIHVAKTIWEWAKNDFYHKSKENKGYLLGKCYAEASKKLVESPADKEEVIEIMKEIESRTGRNYALWQETRNWSIKYFAGIYKELDIKFNHIFYENEVIGAGFKIVDRLFKEGILVKSEGAVIANLEEYNLGVLPIIRTDGTALYPVADLALASEKFDKYNLDESIYIVDIRQSLYFKQLFKLLELMGYKQKLIHLTYDFVTLPDGMMASRTGNIVTYQDIKEKVWNKLIIETKNRHADWTMGRVKHVAWNLTVSVIKFEMLKVNSDRIITFNIEEALRFDGYTACYLQYTYARLKSIIRKESFSIFKHRVALDNLSEQKEKCLLIKLAKYPEIVRSAGQEFNPSELTKYLFELAQLSNDYYHEFTILKAETKVKNARLVLIKSIAQVLKNGYSILGMNALEEM